MLQARIPVQRWSADVGELMSLGPRCPLGERRVVYITSGTFEGPAMRGELVGGADWQILRSDGVLELDARYAIREERGGIVKVVQSRLPPRPAGGDGAARARRGRGSGELFLPRHDAVRDWRSGLAWLNRTIAVASAERKARRVEVRACRLL